MKNFIGIIATALALAAPGASAYEVEFEGSTHKVITETPDRNTGLDAIYVAYNSAELTSLSVTGFNGGSTPVAMRFSNLGGGYAEEIPSQYSGGTLTLQAPQGDMGYIIRDGDRNFCFWLVNYSTHMLRLGSITPREQQECESTTLIFEGEAAPIHYFSINGQQRTLSRDLNLEYTNLEWNDAQKNFASGNVVRELESAQGEIQLMPPVYCGTQFTLSGDRFLSEWGIAGSIESPYFTPHAVAVNTEAEQTGGFGVDDTENASNQIKTETDGLGGSAPAEITFYGYVTDAVRHTEWQMAADENFDNILYRFNEQDLTYTFNEEGQFFLRFIGSNDDGSCEAYGDVYTVAIGASDLRIPNAFSPDGDGTNDEWKVGYRSLTTFKCWIFDRHGQQLFYFDRPDLGWDGKYKGKAVNPGVYYYVIEATGADGRKYKKGGDINILKCEKYSETATPVE